MPSIVSVPQVKWPILDRSCTTVSEYGGASLAINNSIYSLVTYTPPSGKNGLITGGWLWISDPNPTPATERLEFQGGFNPDFPDYDAAYINYTMRLHFTGNDYEDDRIVMFPNQILVPDGDTFYVKASRNMNAATFTVRFNMTVHEFDA